MRELSESSCCRGTGFGVRLALCCLALLFSASAPAKNPYGGIYLIWATGADQYSLDFIDGGQVMLQWKSLHTGEDEYDWGKLDKHLAYFDNLDIKVTLQINGNRKPAFLFQRVPYHSVPHSHQIKDKDGTLMYWHPYYVDQYEKFLIALSKHLKKAAYSDHILGIRMNYNKVGTEHSISVKDMPPKAEWKVPRGVKWVDFESTQNEDYVERINKAYLTYFPPEYKLFLRMTAATSPTIEDALSKGIAGVYQTGAEMEPRYKGDENARYGPFLQWCRTGITDCYAESWAAADGTHGTKKDKRWSTFAQFNYWRILSDLNLGVSYLAVYGLDIERCHDPEFMAAFDFARKYAGYHARPQTSPGAWIAFREGLHLKGDYTFLAKPVPASEHFKPRDLRYNPPQQLGDQSVRFGAWARSLSAGKSIDVEFDKGFIESLSGTTRKLTVTYLDRGTGVLAVKAFGKEQRIQLENTQKWIQRSIEFSQGNSDSVVNLKAKSRSITLHMVEIERI
ncbi:hypothetical protein FT643_12460 [Ketobacter sp. MCCC 1A13808]|uniref:hypothetical protein n=1 Tax=Ketobacter sp. MCCC 1A13808 TaxID=2602738 RepID=UPI0012EC54C3|nr:hypothetical protein [Ketobacter sp. MCCC 1A13808]MVF12952.1 hypothetical protein [Ketobacter sp. MCCC 1A13808]